MISLLALLLCVLTVAALDLERLLKTLKESSTGLSHKYNQTFLNASGLGIETLGNGVFEDFGELTHLDLSLNDIRYVDNLAFAGLKSLSFLDMSHNSGLYTISRDTLFPLENLEEIRLDATHISSLPANLFKHNSKLRKVSLNTPFLVCDCDLQKIAQRFDFDGEARCLYPINLRGLPVKSLRSLSSVCKASVDLQMKVIKSKKERSTGGSYWNIDCSVNNVSGHVIEMKLDGRPLHRRYHDRHHIILQVIENFVPYNPWICYAEVDGAPDAKAFYIAASCPEESIRNGSREVRFARTPPDTVLEIRCPNSSTVLSRECSMAGEWSFVDISICPEVGNSCDMPVNRENIDSYLRTASNCHQGLVMSKIYSLEDKTLTIPDLLTLCSLEVANTAKLEAWNRGGLERDSNGRWKCSEDPLEPVMTINRRSLSRDRTSKIKLLRINTSSLAYILPNPLASEVFGVSVSNLVEVNPFPGLPDLPQLTQFASNMTRVPNHHRRFRRVASIIFACTDKETINALREHSVSSIQITSDTIVLNFTALDRFGKQTLYRLIKDGGVWRKVPQSVCKIRAGFGSKVQVSCSLRLLLSSSDFAVLAVAASCDVEEYYSHRTVLTTKSLITLGLIIYELAGLAPLLICPCDHEATINGNSTTLFLVGILLRSFTSLPTSTTNQLIHAGLLHHSLLWSFSKELASSCLLLAFLFFTLFLSLSVPPISDRFSDGRIYVTPASRQVVVRSEKSELTLSPFHTLSRVILNSSITWTEDSLILLGPLFFLLILALVRTDNRGSRLGLILFPFVWLLILLLRIGETCDSLNSGILDALIIVIPTAHTYLSLRQVNVWSLRDSRKAQRKSLAFHHHISFTEEETSLY
ncbi:hypothetical protein PRIPAC_95389 [Pristionchus pacificus]|uniref:Uncharacterized protein n=1 Tax=Pristionchus pacificus TaxID=54126 RepID=A0A2A6CU83_PRIPA|nr:hypothetical protein PRIPAC_95389 [Pristionchus pacificus]|eukprot:PDM81794.1 hypothetical protein PRIPAC_33948 [Pristionchus pacificus]